MTIDDALLFIDTQIYLDLYRIPSGKRLLAPLSEQSERIFVTQQVVDEVTRNKIEAAYILLSKQFSEIKFQTFKVPDHLFGTTQDESRTILEKMKTIHEDVAKLNQSVSALAEGIMKKVSQSNDEVSMALAPIFARAERHTAEELQRARTRKELGNPPGKQANLLGDQINWEQILSRFTSKSKLWIISRDGDYGTAYRGRGFLNQFLYDELGKVSSGAEAFLFMDIVDGIKDFAKRTGVEATKLPTDAEEAEIKKEIEALPPIFGSAGTFFTPASASLVISSAATNASAGTFTGGPQGIPLTLLSQLVARKEEF